MKIPKIRMEKRPPETRKVTPALLIFCLLFLFGAPVVTTLVLQYIHR